jgi:hypothetical protein
MHQELEHGVKESLSETGEKIKEKLDPYELILPNDL